MDVEVTRNDVRKKDRQEASESVLKTLVKEDRVGPCELQGSGVLNEKGEELDLESTTSH